MSTQRDELAELASDQIGYECRHLGSPDYSVPGGCRDCWDQGVKVADALIAAGWTKPRVIGYVVVDIKTRSLDWDGELHPTEEAAIESLTGHTWWCKSLEEETDERTFYGTVYEILPVVTK